MDGLALFGPTWGLDSLFLRCAHRDETLWCQGLVLPEVHFVEISAALLHMLFQHTIVINQHVQPQFSTCSLNLAHAESTQLMQVKFGMRRLNSAQAA